MKWLFPLFLLVWVWLFAFSLCCAMLDGIKAARSSESRATTASPQWFFRTVFWRSSRFYLWAFLIGLFIYMLSVYAVMVAAGYKQVICIVQSLQIGASFLGLSALFASVCAILAPRCRRPTSLLLACLTVTILSHRMLGEGILPEMVEQWNLVATWKPGGLNNYVLEGFPDWLRFENEADFEPAPARVKLDSPISRFFRIDSLFEAWNLEYGGYGDYGNYGYSSSQPSASAPTTTTLPDSRPLVYGYDGYSSSQPAAARPWQPPRYPLRAPDLSGKPYIWMFVLDDAPFWLLLADLIIWAATWLWIRGDGIHWFRMEQG